MRIVQDLGIILALHVRVTVELRSMFGSAVLRHVINVRAAMLTVHNFSNCLSPLTLVHSLYTSEAIGLPQEPLMTVVVYMFNSDPRSQVCSPVLCDQRVQGFLKLCCCCHLHFLSVPPPPHCLGLQAGLTSNLRKGPTLLQALQSLNEYPLRE